MLGDKYPRVEKAVGDGCFCLGTGNFKHIASLFDVNTSLINLLTLWDVVDSYPNLVGLRSHILFLALILRLQHLA